MAQPFASDRWIFFVGEFAGRAPFIGWLIVWVEILVMGGLKADFPPIASWHGWDLLLGVLFTPILTLVCAYILGMIPALLAGFLCYPLALISMPRWTWLCACAAVGGISAGCVGILFDPSFGRFWLMSSVVPGAIAALVCCWMARQRP